MAQAVTQKVPSTAHNQKKSEGPLPSLVSTLRSDNRDQLLSLLSLDPLANVLTLDEFKTESPTFVPVAHTTRLVFANESLRSLLIYHTLTNDAESKSALLKPKAKPPRNVQSIFTPEEESLGLSPNNPFGIVGTRILLQNNILNDNGNEENVVPGSFTVPGTGHGTETIYNPQRNRSIFSSSMHDLRDETDGASVVIYFIYPTPKHIQALSKAIQSVSYSQKSLSTNPFEAHSTSTRRITKHRIVFLPRINALSKRVLADENLNKRKDVSVHALDINLIPIEDDVITCLEIENTMEDCYVHKTPSEHVTHVAQSLRKIQDICGTIPRVQSYGNLGEMVLERMMSLRLEEYDPYDPESEQDGQENNPEVKAAIILDRAVDLVTPMITPLTYEGLLDDLLKIDAGIIKIETDIISPPEENVSDQQNRPKYMHLPLNDLDTLFVEVRDLHVEKFGSFLQEQAKALKESHANFSDKNKDLTEIHQFVKQIPIFTQNLKSLTNHIHLAELVKSNTEQSDFRQRWQTERSMVESETCYDTIEDLIASRYPPLRLLRLLCLQSITGGGIKAGRYEYLKREIIQTYGYEYLFTLQNLEKVDLLKKRESMWDISSAFSTLRKDLALIQPDIDPSDPDDISYVTSGYAPISIRVIQTAMKGWTDKEEVLRLLPGRGIDIMQRSPPEGFPVAVKRNVGSSLGTWAAQFASLTNACVTDKPVLLVYFVGGLTYAEIASIRFLSKKQSFPFKIIMCTTKIMNGSTFLQSLR
mmetsp:Transcript_8107/g.15269  ORF Transcript_8107/g.15269 Transcript_8107/m.15269 type:complete len:758 (-) Transcript_8107:90-2363(-)